MSDNDREKVIAQIIATYPNWKPSEFLKARLRIAYHAGFKAGREKWTDMTISERLQQLRHEVMGMNPDVLNLRDKLLDLIEILLATDEQI